MKSSSVALTSSRVRCSSCNRWTFRGNACRCRSRFRPYEPRTNGVIPNLAMDYVALEDPPLTARPKYPSDHHGNGSSIGTYSDVAEGGES